MSEAGAIALLIGAFAVSACSQALLKQAATRAYESRLREYLNARVIAAYALFIGATLASVFCMRYLELSLVAALESVAFLFVALLGRLVLKERLNRIKIAGMCVIIAGILIFYLF